MNFKKWILMISSIIVILIIALIAVYTLPKKENIEQNDGRQEEKEEKIIEYNKIEKVKNRDTFFTVTSCVDQYLNTVCSKNAENIYQLLSNQYINNHQVTQENVLEKVENYIEMQIFSANTMYETNYTENISTYYIEGTIRDDIFDVPDTKETEIYIAVQLDRVNKTYAILPNEKVPSSNGIPQINITNIEKKGRNTYYSMNTSDIQMASVYVANYTKLLKNDIKEAYNKLQEEYKQKRFETQNLFSNYIQNKKDYIYELQISNLNVSKLDNQTIYTIRDQYGNRYIVKETAIMEYTIELDDYTLENEAFIQIYKNASNQEKGLLNVDKFFEMINMQDYTSAYAVLDHTFKQNNFKTQIDFENYIKSKTFLYNKVTYKEYNNQIAGIHMYKVELSDATEQNKNKIEFNIVMKLLEETDFVMSFNID